MGPRSFSGKKAQAHKIFPSSSSWPSRQSRNLRWSRDKSTCPAVRNRINPDSARVIVWTEPDSVFESQAQSDRWIVNWSRCLDNKRKPTWPKSLHLNLNYSESIEFDLSESCFCNSQWKSGWWLIDKWTNRSNDCLTHVRDSPHRTSTNNCLLLTLKIDTISSAWAHWFFFLLFFLKKN